MILTVEAFTGFLHVKESVSLTPMPKISSLISIEMEAPKLVTCQLRRPKERVGGLRSCLVARGRMKRWLEGELYLVVTVCEYLGKS